MGIEKIMQQAQEAHAANEQVKQQIPLEMVDADTIPREAPLKYEFLCRIVGSLYIQHQHTLEMAQEQHRAVVNEMKAKIHELMSENRQLKDELMHGNQSPVTASD
jgi:hypothetical protein